jgi:hypothetical protein
MKSISARVMSKWNINYWVKNVSILSIVENVLLIKYGTSSAQNDTNKNLVSLLISSPLVMLTLTNGKVLE